MKCVRNAMLNRPKRAQIATSRNFSTVPSVGSAGHSNAPPGVSVANSSRWNRTAFSGFTSHSRTRKLATATTRIHSNHSSSGL